MKRVVNQIIPFVMLGVAVVAFALGIMILAYVFIFGALIGLVLFTIAWIRNKFFASKKVIKPKPKSGRVIDTDEWKKL